VSTPALDTERLSKSFGRRPAVRDLSLRVGRGEVFGFLGPNGAGKTTSVKMLLGLARPDGGTGHLLGAPLGDRPTRARVGFLPEHFRFHEWLTARELLSFHGRLAGLTKRRSAERAELLLARVGLLASADRRFRDYSKGMQQRAGLAQALVAEPELVFLDEPTSGLDPLGRLLVRDVIRELRLAGTTVFLNSHLLSEVEITCDRVAFVKEGRIVREMVLDAQNANFEVEARLDRVPTGLLDGLLRFGRSPRAEGQTVVLRVDSDSVLPEMTRWLASLGVGLFGLTARRRPLEEVFVEVMEGEREPAPRETALGMSANEGPQPGAPERELGEGAEATPTRREVSH